MSSPQILLQTISGVNCYSLEVFLETTLRLNAALKWLKLGVISPSLHIQASAAVTKPEDLIWAKMQACTNRPSQLPYFALFQPISNHYLPETGWEEGSFLGQR